MVIKNIDLGALAAEDDVSKLRDSHMFLRTKSWESMLDPKVSVFLGRKGSGKSALRIGMEYHASSRRRYTVHLSFSGFSNKLLANKLKSLENHPDFPGTRQFFSNLWRYAIVTSAICKMLDGGDIPEMLKGVVGNWSELIWNPLELPNCLTEKKTYSLFNVFATGIDKALVWFNSNSDPQSKINYPISQRFRTVESMVLRAFKDNLSMLVIVDDFDRAYEEFHEILQPQLIAVVEAVQTLKTLPEYSENFSVKCLLPRDAITPDVFRHLDKVAHANVEWNRNELRLLLARRLHRSIQASAVGIPREVLSDQDASKVLEQILPSILSNEGDYPDGFTWLHHCTLERPRDLIFLVHSLRDSKCVAEPKATRFDEADLYSHLPAACRALAEMVIGEYVTRFPQIRTVIDAFSGESERAALHKQEVIQKIKNASVPGDPYFWLEALVEVGFMGAVWKVSQPGGYLAKRAAFSSRFPSADLAKAEEFVIHQIFWHKCRVLKPDWAFKYAD